MSNLLQSKAQELKELNIRIAQSVRSTLEMAMQAGQLLIEIKEGLPHGIFTNWIHKHCDISPETARRYMRVYERREELKTVTVTGLSDAYRYLAAPSEDACQGELDALDDIAPVDEGGQDYTDDQPFDDEPEAATQDEDQTWPDEPNIVGPKMTDKAGVEIPDELIPIWQDAQVKFGAWRQQLNQMLADAQRWKESGVPCMQHIHIDNFRHQIDQVKEDIKFSRPYAVCPYCGGDGGVDGNCRACNGGGWVNEMQYAACPSEFKQNMARFG